MIKLPIFEITIKEDEEYLGLSIVNNPAIGKNYIYFNEDVEIKMDFNEEQMIVKGPALIPEKLIYRNDALGERYVYFTKESIKKFAELLVNKNKNKFNTEHTDNYINANIVESYFATKDNDFNVPEGSWIVSLHILDNDVWNKIKTGEYQGFSVQGLFANEMVKFMSDKKENKKMELKEKLLNAINVVLFGEEEQVEVETKVEEDLPVVEEEEVVEETIDYSEKFEGLNNTINELNTKLEQYNIKFEELKKLVEEYAKQPISQSVIAEEVATANPLKGISKATKYFTK